MVPRQLQVAILLIGAIQLVAISGVQAGQGCPFDDNSCQEYCNQQGCNLGYCGHFAWIQCICRKCGDEWSWYDKVKVNDKQQVNQTELESLKLNVTATSQDLPSSLTATTTNTTTTTTTQAPPATGRPQQSQLTLLLVPDLSNERLDMNDIPDENSDKFLDYLAKNHERLVQATSAENPKEDHHQQQQSQQQQQQQPQDDQEELVELQISSNSNQAATQNTLMTQQPTTQAPPTTRQQQSPVIRLLRMAVVERNSEEID